MGGASAMRRVLAPALSCLGLLVLFLVLAPAASAHATVVSSTPADGSRLQHAPTRVVITFDEPVGLGGIGFLHVTDQSGRAVDVGTAVHPGGSATTIAERLRPGLGDGAYTASYRVISADSHPVAGSIAFVVGNGALVHGSVSGSSTVNSLTGASDDVARWIGYAGLALLGGCWLLFTGWPRGRDVERARRLVWTGWVLLASGTVLQVLLQGPYTAGDGLSGLTDLHLLDDTLHTSFGTTLCLRLLLLSALALVFERSLRDGAEPQRGDALVGLFGVGVLATFAAVGHASTTAPNWLSMTVDGLHLAAMATWLGGLVILLAAVLPNLATDGARSALARFSTVAFVSVTVLAVTGSYAAWRGVGTVHAVFSTTYGVLVDAKIVLFVGIVAVANLSRKNVQRRVRAGADDYDETVERELLRRSVLVEVAVAAIVLAVTAVLVNEPRGKEALVAQYSEPVTVTAQLSSTAGVAVTVSPALHGPVDITVDVQGETHPTVTATATQHDAEIGPLPIKLAPTHAHGTDTELDAAVTLPVAGQWDIDLVVSTSKFDAITTNVTVTLH